MMLGSSAWYRSFPVSMGVITTLISTIVQRTLKDRWFDVEGSSCDVDTGLDTIPRRVGSPLAIASG